MTIQSCNQYLNVQVEISTKWLPSKVTAETSTAECLYWWHEQWDGVHPAQAWREHQAQWCGWCARGKKMSSSMNLVKCKKAKCKVLHLDWGNYLHQWRLEDKWVENSSGENNLGVLTDKKLNQHKKNMDIFEHILSSATNVIRVQKDLYYEEGLKVKVLLSL